MADAIGQSVLSLLAGNFMGSLADRVVSMMDQRLRTIEALRLGTGEGSLVEGVLSLTLHVGILSVGVNYASRAMPWMIQDPAAFLMFQLGVWSNSTHLITHLRAINSAILNDESYKAESQVKEKPIDVKPEVATRDESA